jgi:acyl-CoA thioesterase FadM
MSRRRQISGVSNCPVCRSQAQGSPLAGEGMSTIFAERARVRAYECDSLGHLNNAVYIQYLLQATLDAVGAAGGEGALPTARKLAIEYHTPARYGDELDIATWVIDANDSGTMRGYAATRTAGCAKVVGAPGRTCS